VKGFAEWDGISISIYGGESRRVVSSEGTMEVTGKVPVERVEDDSLPKGQRVVESEGAPPRRTSVTRTVYAADGTLLQEETWTTSYKSEPRVVIVGTKEAKPPEREGKAPGGGKRDEAAPPAKGDATSPPDRP